MSQDFESILRKSLDDVDRSQKWQIAGLVIFLIFLVLHVYGFIGAIHGARESGSPSGHAIAIGIFSIIFMIGSCSFGITWYISRMAKRILKAIELSSKS